MAPFALTRIDAADRLVVAGPSAIAAVIAGFESGADLDWSAQVTCVATPPAHRQLAALGGALLNTTHGSRVVTAGEPVPKGTRALVSDDASPGDAEVARGSC